MDIDGLGERYIEDLTEFDIVKSVADLYALTLDDLLAMKRQADERDGTTPETVKSGKVATKWAENLIAAIDKSRHTTLDRFLYSLGIPNVGETTAKTLVRYFGGLDAIMNASQEELLGVPDVGPIVAAHIHAFFAEPRNRKVVADLRKNGVEVERARAAANERRSAGGQNRRADRFADLAHARRSERQTRSARRESVGQRVEEDELHRRRRGSRIETRQGAGTRRRHLGRSETDGISA